MTERKDGTRHLYRVDPEGLAALRMYLETFWTDALAAFKEVAERGRRNSVIEPINASVIVRRSPEDAFRVFTQDMGSWWPLQAFSMAADTYADRGVKAETVVLEEREGGRVYEVMSDGTEGTWATILAWDPPRRFVLAWKPNLHRQPADRARDHVHARRRRHPGRPGAPRVGASRRPGGGGTLRIRRELDRRAVALRRSRRAVPRGGMTEFRDQEIGTRRAYPISRNWAKSEQTHDLVEPGERYRTAKPFGLLAQGTRISPMCH